MKIIRERENRNGNYYEVEIEGIVVKRVNITIVQRNVDGVIYYIPFRSNGEIIEEVFSFLNIEYMNTSEGIRNYLSSAIKCLYSYLELFEKNIHKLDRVDIKVLSNFILGQSTKGMNEEALYITNRSNGTHNLYFDCIRKFFRYLKIDNEYLFERLNKITLELSNSFLDSSTTIEVSKFAINKKSSNAFKTSIPKYISLEEYSKIIKYNDEININNRDRNNIIINLMYKYGMRLGEVLGLTIEDIKKKKGQVSGATLIIRNRMSDKRYQNAKTCMKIKSKLTYNTRQYKTEFKGYEKIEITNKMYEDIINYIDKSTNVLDISDKIFDNIQKYAIADSVEGNKENYYIFLNKNGSPLSYVGWNKYLRTAYKAIDIEVDSEIRKNNLSHRFRHGFAMYLIDIEKMPIEYVKDAMRHRSIKSTLIYYNPKEEEKLKRAEIIENRINEIINGEKNDG